MIDLKHILNNNKKVKNDFIIYLRENFCSFCFFFPKLDNKNSQLTTLKLLLLPVFDSYS